MAILRRLWPGVMLGVAAGYTMYFLFSVGNVQAIFGVDPIQFAQYTALITGTTYIIESEIKKAVAERKAKEKAE